jgi:hypothetical protein
MRALSVLTVCLVAFASSGHLSAAAELKVGDAAPDFMLQASNGKTYKVSDFRLRMLLNCPNVDPALDAYVDAELGASKPVRSARISTSVQRAGSERGNGSPWAA